MVTKLSLAAQSLCCRQLRTVNTLSLSSHHVVTVLSRWLMEKDFCCVHGEEARRMNDLWTGNAKLFFCEEWGDFFPNFRGNMIFIYRKWEGGMHFFCLMLCFSCVILHFHTTVCSSQPGLFTKYYYWLFKLMAFSRESKGYSFLCIVCIWPGNLCNDLYSQITFWSVFGFNSGCDSGKLKKSCRFQNVII